MLKKLQARVYIGLGANLGDGIVTLARAWQRLGEIDGIDLIKISSPYSTAPVDMESDNRFINAVGSLSTTLSPDALLHELLGVEAEWGRVRRSSLHEDRPLDLDILFYNDLIREEAGIVLPHPRCAERLFVLAPLAEIAPDLMHPILGRTATELLDTHLATYAGRAEHQAMRRLSWPESTHSS